MKKTNLFRQLLAVFCCLALLLSGVVLPAAAASAGDSQQSQKPQSVSVSLSFEQDNYYFVFPKTVSVSAGLSDKYGYVDQVKDGVSVLDGLIAIHEIMLAEAFTPETKDSYLVVSDEGFVSTVMGDTPYGFGFAVNGFAPNDGVYNESYHSYTGYTANQAKLENDDVLQFFFYNPEGYYGEIYTNFLQGDNHITRMLTAVGREETLTVKGYSFVYEGTNREIKWKAVAEKQVCLATPDGAGSGSLTPVDGVITGQDGSFKIKFEKAGSYQLAVASDPDAMTYIIPQICNVTVVEKDAYAAVEDAIAKIDAIGKVTRESKAAIEAADAACKLVPNDLKSFVHNYNELSAAKRAYALAAPASADVTLSLEKDNIYSILPEKHTVSSDLSEKYGYTDQLWDSVSVLDGLIAAHQILLGEKFTPETSSQYLNVGAGGFITKVMGIETMNISFAVNGFAPNDGVVSDIWHTYTGYSANQAKLVDNDVLQFFFYNPDGYYGEIYTNFLQGDTHITELMTAVGKEETLTVKGYSFMMEGMNPEIKWKPVADKQICLLSTEGETAGQLVPVKNVITGEDGSFKIKFDKPGTYLLAVTSDPENMAYIVPQLCTVTVLETQDDVTAVHNAIDKINAIGKVTPDSLDAIKEARAAFDALTEQQQTLVPNASALIAAEEAIMEIHPHSYEWIVTKAPTKDAPGQMVGTCVCGDTVTVEIPALGQSGSITSAPQKGDAFQSHLADKEFYDKVTLTDSEKQALIGGQDLNLSLKVSDITGTVSAADKALIEKALKNNTLGTYLDVTLLKQVGENAPTALTTTLGNVTVSLVLPEALKNTDKNVTRSYQVVRIHNGAAALLDAVFDAETGILTFETNQFSTYAVVYSDQTNPATGDSFSAIVLTSAMVGSLLCLAYTVRKKISF